jgi:predicted Rossmann fold flavoprotein
VKQEFDAIVIGAGAAGLMCAIEAGKRGRRVVLLDHAERIGKKILISGGGRCNFTNLHCRPENFLSNNPHFAKSALARYTPADFIGLVQQYRIPYHEKTLGQLFCDRSAQDVLSMLEEECRRAKVTILTKQRVLEVSRPSGFVVRTADDEFHAPALVIAAGGLSIPKIGATSFGYDIARQFGLKIVETRPALVPLMFGEADRKRWCDLAGVAAEVVASTDHQQFREKMLITHRGLSGPAILQISSYWRKSQAISIDLAPERDLTSALLSGKRDIALFKAALRDVLPNRLAERWAEVNPPAKWTNSALEEAEGQLHRWQVIPVDTEGYEKAEVTAGGVDTDDLSAKTMESRRVPGLYFIGEVVDVTGHLGGFNFQWAWASGSAAGGAV